MAAAYLARLRELAETGHVERLANRYSQTLDVQDIQLEIALRYSAESEAVRAGILDAAIEAYQAGEALDLLQESQGLLLSGIPRLLPPGSPIRATFAVDLLDQATGAIVQRTFQVEIARGDTRAIILQELQAEADRRYQGRRVSGSPPPFGDVLPVVVGFSTYSLLRG